MPPSPTLNPLSTTYKGKKKPKKKPTTTTGGNQNDKGKTTNPVKPTTKKTTTTNTTKSNTNNTPIDKKLLAERYGWALSVLQSQPELWKLFNKAVKENWTAQKFSASLHGTNWWKKNSDQYRQMYVLEKSDPAKWKRIQTEMFSKVHDLASSMGVKYNADLFGKITRQALYNGWSDSQIRNSLGGLIDASSGSHYGGEAGAAEDQLRAYAYSQGIKLSDASLKTWLQRMAKGDMTIQDYEGYIQKMAEQSFPGYADQIKSGVTVRQLADNYIQSMANILEINPTSIDLFDPTIRSALNGSVDAKGQGGGNVPLWQFETNLKKDPRWLKTNNAREGINSVARNILRDFGFAY